MISSLVAGAAKGIAGPLFGLIDELFTSDEERENAKIRLIEMEQKGQLAQVAVNLAEAQNENAFVSGWRPFVGWVCGAAFAYSFVLQPFLTFGVNVTATYTGGPVFDPTLLPFIDMGPLMTVLGGMLGLAGLRTYEKRTGANKKR